MSNLDKIKQFFDSQGRIKIWPTKANYKLLILDYLAEKFQINRLYSEKEVNDILNTYHIFCDPALLRRELYEAKILDRTINCKEYWKIGDSSDRLCRQN